MAKITPIRLYTGGIVASVGNKGFRQLFIGGYNSFGDSIAAGHTIDENWVTDYGEDSQYGVKGNTETMIVPNSYTDIIKNEIVGKYGDGASMNTKSFARSGDRVYHLLQKLQHENVVDSIKKASIVTICIGANDILEPAIKSLEDYINYGDLTELEGIVNENLNRLNTDSDPNSYTALMDRLIEINPSAKYIFTTVYNPVKYLWLDEGKEGFLKPVFDAIPQATVLGFEIDEYFKDEILNINEVKLLFNRVNGIGDWAETPINRLNDILKEKAKNYSNVYIADSHLLFDGFPDRPVNAQKHYNDLISVEYTRGYTTATMSWGALWRDSDYNTYWNELFDKHRNKIFTKLIDYESLLADLIPQVLEKVIIPDVDPHPEWYGHYVLYRCFADVLGWEKLDRYTITYNAGEGNGGTVTQEVTGVDGLPVYVKLKSFKHSTEGWRFDYWEDEEGNRYSNEQLVGITKNLKLTAHWTNYYTITCKHTNLVNNDGGETGHQECFELWMSGKQMPTEFGKFSEGVVITYDEIVYGTPMGVYVTEYFPKNAIEWLHSTPRVYLYNHQTAKYDIILNEGEKLARYDFPQGVTSNITIEFAWESSGSKATFNYREWYDCYIRID